MTSHVRFKFRHPVGGVGYSTSVVFAKAEIDVLQRRRDASIPTFIIEQSYSQLRNRSVTVCAGYCGHTVQSRGVLGAVRLARGLRCRSRAVIWRCPHGVPLAFPQHANEQFSGAIFEENDCITTLDWDVLRGSFDDQNTSP